MSITTEAKTELGVQTDPVPITWGTSRQGDKLNRMRPQEWYQTVREMVEQDATIGAVFYAIEMTIRRVDWRVVPAAPDPETAALQEALKPPPLREPEPPKLITDEETGEAVATEAVPPPSPAEVAEHDAAEAAVPPTEQEVWAQFVDECMDDLDMPFPSKLAEIASFIPFGFAFFETVYKIRGGLETNDPAMRSAYDDKKIGWRKWSYRAPESLEKWEYKDGELSAFVQRLPDYQTATIPVAKGILFRAGSRYANPEGVSLLKRIYRAWRYKQEIENAEAIGVYRDLAGLLVLGLPASVMRSRQPADVQIVNDAKKTLRNVHRGLQEGLMIPTDTDERGNRLYDAKLMPAPGSRQFDTTKIIDRYKSDIAMTLLADFLQVGHQNVGTYSTSESKLDFFMVSMNAWLDVITTTITEQAIWPLMQINGVPREHWPGLEHGEPQQVDLASMAAAFASLVTAKAIDMNNDVQAAIHEALGLPPPDEQPAQSDVEQDNVSYIVPANPAQQAGMLGPMAGPKTQVVGPAAAPAVPNA